ncbi:hypothetical protein ACGVWS_07100 [Enterobacteriaceae bacterium LUAb1]
MMEKRIFQLGQELDLAAQNGRWNDVKSLDRQIAVVLTELRKQHINPELFEPLTQLKKRHTKVIQTCNEELGVLCHKLALYREKREGLQAYALFAEPGDVL